MAPFTEQQCFFVAILVFMVIGFQRGWRRELVSLVFVLIAFCIMFNPVTCNGLGDFLQRLPVAIGFIAGTNPAPSTASTQSFLANDFWALLFFLGLVGLGYYVGNRAFPCPASSHERFVGIVPAVIAGAFIIYFVTNRCMKKVPGQATVTVQVPSPDPNHYIALILLIAITAIVVAFIAARAKKLKK
ncbi:MAG TPA: hypothetical protein VL461_07255 [Dictyobacter sp.]|jgi:hypothetical protein|nr:hypothetical protein [Dictyobacter sp.]